MKRGFWRQVALAIAALATLLAVWFAPSNAAQDVVLTKHAQPIVLAMAPSVPAALNTGRDPEVVRQAISAIRVRAMDKEDIPTLFTPRVATSGTFPYGGRTQVIVHQEPVQPPQVPLLPFQVLGRYRDSGGDAVFLQYQERNLVVRMGDTIDQTYKIESIDAATLGLRYLPMDQLQTMDLGSVN